MINLLKNIIYICVATMFIVATIDLALDCAGIVRNIDTGKMAVQLGICGTIAKLMHGVNND